MKYVSHKIVLCFLFAGIIDAKAQVINAGVGGNNTENLLDRVDEDVLAHQPDLVILMVGTNDMLNSRKVLSFGQYEANLEKLIHKIKSKNAKILLLSPPPVDSVYLFQRHDKKLFPQGPNAKLETARQIISKLANANKLRYFDLYQVFRAMKLPKHNEDLFFKNEKNSEKKDGVHPTSLGYRFIAETLFHYLKSEMLLTGELKIICFGDSITYGGGVKSEEGVLSEDYPSVLSRLIKKSKKKLKK